MIPSWYDVLGVDDDASADEVRAAWQDSIAGLDPTDRRFKQRNRAAEVLLDPARRAAHDRELAAQDLDDDEDGDELPDVAPNPVVAPVRAASPASDRGTGSGSVTLDKRTDRLGPAARATAGTTPDTPAGTTDSRPRRGAVGLTVGLGVLALLLLVASLVSLVAGGGSDGPDADGAAALPDVRQIEAARRAAETASGPVLSYDYRNLEESRAAAVSFMTPQYAETYEENFVLVEDNAPTTQTIVTAEVVSSGVVRTGEDRVDVLVFVNRPTRNASGDTVSRDQVTLRMLDVDDRWLVDCLITEPGGTC